MTCGDGARCSICDDYTDYDDGKFICDECLLAAQNRPPWQPIEKAPLGGTRFLFTNGHIVGSGFYVARKHFAADSWQGTNTPTIPTHWMLLPELPKKVQE